MATLPSWSDRQLSIFSSAGLPAKTSPSQDSEPGSTESADSSRSSSCASFSVPNLDGWYGRTSPVSCLRTEDGRLAPSSGGWLNAGMGSPGGCWTRSMSEWTDTLVPSHSDGGVSSLSDVLEETGSVPGRFYLSQRACAGILRRAAKRGKALPPLLDAALRQVAGDLATATEEPGEESEEAEEAEDPTTGA